MRSIRALFSVWAEEPSWDTVCVRFVARQAFPGSGCRTFPSSVSMEPALPGGRVEEDARFCAESVGRRFRRPGFYPQCSDWIAVVRINWKHRCTLDVFLRVLGCKSCQRSVQLLKLPVASPRRNAIASSDTFFFRFAFGRDGKVASACGLSLELSHRCSIGALFTQLFISDLRCVCITPP